MKDLAKLSMFASNVPVFLTGVAAAVAEACSVVMAAWNKWQKYNLRLLFNHAHARATAWRSQLSAAAAA
jgi:hypothetical protein